MVPGKVELSGRVGQGPAHRVRVTCSIYSVRTEHLDLLSFYFSF
jgi:hypothetical protein